MSPSGTTVLSVDSSLVHTTQSVEMGPGTQIQTASATAGTLTGDSFAVFDFTSANEDLIVTVDGGSAQTISIVTNCDTTANCASALSGLITGATVAATGDGASMVITSDTTGASSSVAITDSGSGANALLLFGTLTAVAGADSFNAGVGVGTLQGGINGSVALPLNVLRGLSTGIMQNVQQVIQYPEKLKRLLQSEAFLADV